MADEIVTTDLAKFGYRELRQAAEILTAYVESPPDHMSDGIHLAFNSHSGCVFLVDEDLHVAMMNDGKLEEWITCMQCGEEGFPEDVNLCEDGCCQGCHAAGKCDCETGDDD